MLFIEPTRPNAYTGSPLDRASGRRGDAAFLASALAASESLFVPLWRTRNLLRDGRQGGPEAVFLSGESARALRPSQDDGPVRPWAFLGLWNERAVFAVDASEAEDPHTLVPAAAGSFRDLRPTTGVLAAPEAAVLAGARALLHWQSRHRFCGVCGGPCRVEQGGHVLRCSQCGTEHFPRTDPAVIMLVHRGDSALLGHSAHFPAPTMYSTLAGFVEPGESLEEAVAREVFEETGVRVRHVRYHSSQPWPFPASLMLGFYAEATDAALAVDRAELEDARWFSSAEIRNPEAGGFTLPRPDSIARRLIEDWVAAT